MKYFEYRPAAPLHEFIEKIWYCESENHDFSCSTVPVFTHELVINWSDSYLFRPACNINFVNSPSWISGIQNKPITIESKENHKMMGVYFKVHGLRAFSKCPLRELEHQYVEPSKILDPKFSRLVDNLSDCVNLKKRFELLEGFLIKSLNNVTRPIYILDCIKYFYYINRAKVTVQSACERYGISNKSLIAAFDRHVGTTPTKFLQLCRINLALKYISQNPNQSIINIAHNLNFFDHAHFSNAFKSMVGVSPSMYAQYCMSGHIVPSEPNYIFDERVKNMQEKLIDQA